jgi:monomeric sarcosine oxidase
MITVESSSREIMQKELRVAVIGAGAFGGWTALYLLRRGARVTLLDIWGPGNSRASSGGETRILRSTYGPNQPYSKMATRAARLWTEHEKKWQCELFHRTGVLWMARSGNDQFERESLPALGEAAVTYEELPVSKIAQRWPQINPEGISWGIYEPHGGYLLARRACQVVLEQFRAEGGEYRQSAAKRDGLEDGVKRGLSLTDGSILTAERYVFACGAWMGKLFPETIGNKIRSTKQDVFFFGTPGGDDRWSEEKLPVWADHGDTFIYGIPSNQGRGFKIADDSRGCEFDPDVGERLVSIDGLKKIREYLALRFPGMKDAPLLETRVCQYENTPDGNFIVDRHPAADDVWLIGGGSGHGFKHGPALGEMIADLILKEELPEPLFQIARFSE